MKYPKLNTIEILANDELQNLKGGGSNVCREGCKKACKPGNKNSNVGNGNTINVDTEVDTTTPTDSIP